MIGEFNFDAESSDAGWRRWREELEERQRAFESRWGLVLGKRVRVILRDHAKALEGKIEWVDRDEANTPSPPRFRLRRVRFGHEEIKSIV